jgi:hypothetical protein
MATEQTIREAGPHYLSLQQTLSESEWAVAALPQVTKTHQAAETAAKSTKEQIRKFDKRSQNQLERFNNLKHHSVKRAWYRTTGKLEEKIEEEEKAWLKEYEQVQAVKAKGQEQDKEVDEARKIKDQCVRTKATFEKAQKDLKSLLEGLFDGPTPSFPSEDALEQSLAMARQRHDDINILAKRQTYITNSLQRAHQCLVGALQALQSSLQMNTYDMFSHGGYADWMVHSALGEARDLATRAQFLVNEVRRLEPSIPHLGDIHIEQDNLVFNIVFDNIFTDLRMRQIIQQSYSKIQRAVGVLQREVLPQVVNKTQSLQAQIESCATEVRRLEKAIWNERSRIMTEIVGDSGHNVGSARSASATHQEPRVYEAPPAPPETSGPPPPSFDLPADEPSTDEPPPPYTLRGTPLR